MSKITQKRRKVYNWTYDEYAESSSPEPYDNVSPAQVSELVASDKSTALLLLFDGWNETTGYSTRYGIEAPHTCIMRQAFERGELSWEDFWTREGEVYRLMAPFNPGPLIVNIIPTSQLPRSVLDVLRFLGCKSPYDIKEERLRRYWEVLPSAWQEGKSEAERNYKAYLARCGHLLSKTSAA